MVECDVRGDDCSLLLQLLLLLEEGASEGAEQDPDSSVFTQIKVVQAFMASGIE